jgi:CheY-like chemotaxis protein
VTLQKWILLAEDNANDADLAMRVLTRDSMREKVVLAHDGLEALNCLNHRGEFQTCPSEIPTVVLLDLKMPKVDGLEVLRQIKSDERLKTIPIVIFTSSCEASDLERCYELGANAYVVKPVDFKKFREVVEEVRAFWMDFNEPPPALAPQPSAAAA